MPGTDRLGKWQLRTIRVMQSGAVLIQEGRGMWHLEEEGYRVASVYGRVDSLIERGYVIQWHKEEHPAYRGGWRAEYRLTEKGKQV